MLYSGLHLYEEAVLGFPLPLRERDRVRGKAVATNLLIQTKSAVACVSCSLRKAARQTALDPQTGQGAALFNPRRDIWPEHFRWEGIYLAGLTATGRATITALDINRTLILAIRQEETALGRHPSS